jgi:hypothetical protein
MERIFLIKALHEESRNPYKVTLDTSLQYRGSVYEKPMEITQHFKNWQHPSVEELEYFNIVYGELALEAYGIFLDTFREILKRFMEDREL